MAPQRDVNTPYTGAIDGDYAAGGKIAFGAYCIKDSAGVAKAAEAADTEDGIGFAVQPANGVVLDVDGFYSLYNAMRLARNGIINALVATLGDTDINDGDYLEVGAWGDAAPGNHGVLAEAGAGPDGQKTLTAVAKALEDVDMGDESYKVPAQNVAVGDKTITFAAADLTALNLSEGDLILLRDINANCQLNRVKSLTSTVVTLQFAATVALTVADSDLVNKVFQCRALIL